MKSRWIYVILFAAIFLTLSYSEKSKACTTAIISGGASSHGGPMLWKNRDTDFLSNKVLFVEEKPFNYIGLVNEEDPSGRYVYAGLNSEGFGIINSVAYNLPQKGGEMKDLEGLIMADALRTCRNADDFEIYLKKNLGPDLGSWANFGVVDAQGNAVIFEVHNHGYKKIDAAAAKELYLVNSNFSRSGDTGKGAGYLRFDRASLLFNQISPSKISHTDILHKIARDFGHTLLTTPTLDQIATFSPQKPAWIETRDTINRTITSAAVVICGKTPGKSGSISTFWCTLGEPLTSIAVPVWVEAGETPSPFRGDEKAPICTEALRIKKLIHPYTEMDKENYMAVTALDNKEKSGFLPTLLKVEKEIFNDTARFLLTGHSKDEYAAFQEKAAQKVLQTLKEIK